MAEETLSTLDKISMIVQKYQAVPHDYRNIEVLTSWNRKLACTIFDYTGEVGDLYKSAKAYEFARKAAYERERIRLIKEDGKSASAADAEAKSKVEEELENEVNADADYRSAMMQLQGARDVLEAMRQHISSIKQEMKLEMTGQGSQST